MNRFKTPVCSIVAVAAFAFGAFGGKATASTTVTNSAPSIGTVTNYSNLSISLTVTTNIETIKGTHVTFQTRPERITNKNILALLATSDFANEAWPAGAQLVVGWDQQWSNDVLVVDRTGTNVLYDATTGNSGRTLQVNFFNYHGTWSENFNGNNPGGETYTVYNNGYFELYDVSQNIYLWSDGASTESFDLNWNKEGIDTTWSDTEKFYLQSAGVSFESATGDATLSGSIIATGHGKGTPYAIQP